MYDGGSHESNTYVKQAVSVASRISKKTIHAIGEVCNKDCSDIILEDLSLNKEGFRSIEEVISQKDCRLFRKFICFGALRAAKSFMSAVNDGLAEAQVNCIYRLRHWSESHEYKSVPTKIVVEQYNFSILALSEEKKFLELLGNDDWPPNMETINENVLRTTLCDAELSSNSGNDTDVLPLLWNAFKRIHPGKARGIEMQEEGFNQDDSSNNDPPSTTCPETSSDNSQNSIDSEEEVTRAMEREKEEKENERKMKLRRDGDRNLKESSIVLSNMAFKSYLTETWTSKSEQVDLIVSAISKTEDTDIVMAIPSFCKTVLKAGSYGLFIVSQAHFFMLFKLFKDGGFETIESPFVILYDRSTIQKRIIVDFPLKDSDVGLLVKTPGTHPAGYSPIFCEASSDLARDDVTVFASVINLKSCQNKLKPPNKMAVIRTEEKSVELYKHIIKMLSPPRGVVMDPLGGTFTCALACLDTGRSCISMEQDWGCFRYAAGRARIFATPEASMTQLEDYADPIPPEEESEKDISEVDGESPQKNSQSKEITNELNGGILDLSQNKKRKLNDGSQSNDTELIDDENLSSMNNCTTDNMYSKCLLKEHNTENIQVDSNNNHEREKEGIDALLQMQATAK